MDESQALVHSTIQVGYLKLSAISGSKRTVYEESNSEMVLIETARERLETACEPQEKGLKRHVRLSKTVISQRTRWKSWPMHSNTFKNWAATSKNKW
jgi:hypothetical protein